MNTVTASTPAEEIAKMDTFIGTVNDKECYILIKETLRKGCPPHENGVFIDVIYLKEGKTHFSTRIDLISFSNDQEKDKEIREILINRAMTERGCATCNQNKAKKE